MTEVVTASNGVSLRSAGEQDVDRLVDWHADPDVRRFWDDETFTPAEMEERLARPNVDAWIVEENGEPVGYLQTHAEGLDMFLVPAARGRGIGPAAARAMARHLIDDRGYASVTVDPYEWNESGIRSWQRAGFVELSRGQPPDEDHVSEWVLMEFVG